MSETRGLRRGLAAAASVVLLAGCGAAGGDTDGDGSSEPRPRTGTAVLPDLDAAMAEVCDTPVEEDPGPDEDGYDAVGAGRTELLRCELDQGTIVFGARYDRDPREDLEEIWQLGREADGDALYWAAAESGGEHVAVYYTGWREEERALEPLAEDGWDVHASIDDF